MNDKLQVLILAAGYGRRMGPFSRMINKALVPYHNRALISHIFDRFPADTEFVIACGHLAQQVKGYVTQVHPSKDVTFVTVENYAEKTTGPATSVLSCRPHLKQSFLVVTCDTLFEFDYSDKLDHSWIAVHPVDQAISQDYCWVTRNGDKIVTFENKVPAHTAVDAFIGLMYIHDHEYLNNLEEKRARELYEGFVNIDVRAHSVYQWQDFGTYEKWQQLNGPNVASLVKPNEIFYNDNNTIAKYFADNNSVVNRVRRSTLNTPCMPSNVRSITNFLFHDWVQGTPVYENITPQLFVEMLNWCADNLWLAPSEIDHKQCRKDVEYFYKQKTFERLQQFRVKHVDWAECLTVNGVAVGTIDYYLGKVDWDKLIDNYSWCFLHGDLHFDNLVIDQDGKFTCIDWRPDFAGQMYGDIYYDLAKLLGGIRLNYMQVRQGMYSYEETAGAANILIPSVAYASVYENLLRMLVKQRGLLWSKVEYLVGIIYINMSPLHEQPLDKVLIGLSQLHFDNILRKDWPDLLT